MGVEIAVALGFSGIAATLTGAAINAGVGLALSFGAQTLLGKKGSQSGGASVSLQVAADAPRQAILGETAVGGSLVYWHLTGPNNENLTMVIALADHECDSLQGVIVNGDLRTWDSATGVVAGTDGTLVVRFHSGAPGQVADAALVAGSNGAWTANHRGEGVCYVVAEIVYREKVWPGGIPTLAFVVRGANRLVDPRTGVRGYSDNWGVVVYNALLGIRQGDNGPRVAGLHCSAVSISATDAIAACNAADELVALAAGGTEKRFRVGAVLDSGMTGREVLETLLAAAAGSLVESAGTYRVLPGVAQTPVASISDGDLILGQRLQFEPRVSRAELVNTVEATWFDRSNAWVSAALPARSASADVTADGGVRLARALDLVAVPSRTQAQRVMEIERRRARRQGRAACTVTAQWQGLEAGDWISFTSDRRGWVAKTFVVARTEETPTGAVDLLLVETDAALDDWTTSLEIAPGTAVDLPSAGPPVATVAGLALTTYTAEAVNGAQRPGLRLTWTAVDDPTVISLLLEYRRQGDTAALQRAIMDPDAGAHSWVSGVQGGVVYEARLRAVTQPDRDATWTPWAVSSSVSPDDVVSVAVVAESVPPGTITNEMLDEQVAFELALATAIAEVQGSVAQRLASVEERFERFASAVDLSFEGLADTDARVTNTQRQIVTERLALAEQITQAVVQLQGETAGAIQTLTARVEDTEGGLTSQAAIVSGVQTQVGDNTAAISDALQSIDGLSARWTLDLNVSGRAHRLITAGGDQTTTFVGFEVDSFFIGRSNINGGAPVQVFTVDTTGPTPRLVFNGDFFASGSITAQHLDVSTLTAITAEFGTATVTGQLTGGPGGKLIVDFTNGRIRGVA